MEDYLPDLKDALSQLKKDCSKYRIPLARTEGESDQVRRKRHQLVEECVEAAAQSDLYSDEEEEEESDGVGWGREDYRGSDSSSGSGTDSDGGRYKERKPRREKERDLGQVLADWVGVLNK